MSLQDLADRVGVAPSHIFHIENGDKVPSEELAAKLAGALGEQKDEVVYRAWARIRQRTDLRTALRAAPVIVRYLIRQLQGKPPLYPTLKGGLSTEDLMGALESEPAGHPAADDRPDATAGASAAFRRPESTLLSMSSDSASRLQLAQDLIGPRPTRVLIPLIPEGEDPGDEVKPPVVTETLRIEPRLLSSIESLERPFAYPLSAESTRRVRGLFPDRGIAIISRRFLPLAVDEVYAVRLGGRVALTRLLWNARQLLLLPAPGQNDFELLPAASEPDLAMHIVGRVAAVRAEP